MAAVGNEVNVYESKVTSDTGKRPKLRSRDTDGRLKVDTKPVCDGKAKASADNAAATATVAAPAAGYQLGVTHLDAGFSDETEGAALLQITEDVAGTPAVIWEGYVAGVGREVNFDPPLSVTAAKSVSGVLAASSAGGILGKVNIVTVTQKVGA